MKPEFLILTPAYIPDAYMDKFKAMFTVIIATKLEEQERLRTSGGLKNVRAVYTLGSKGVSVPMLDAMANLEIIVCKGAGYDGFDVAEMRRRGLALSHGPALNATSVADHAIALMMATVKRIPQLHARVMAGEWLDLRTPIPLVREKRLGILGLGRIGRQIADMAQGLKMDVSYHARNKRDDVPYTYRATPVELAAGCDILIAVCPLNDSTHHIVSTDVLNALGPNGYAINLARGAVFDTKALVAALDDGRLAGAGLDVVEGEPVVPDILLNRTDVVITPHVGGESIEAGAAIHDLLIANLEAHFAGRPLVTPIPE